MEKLSEADRIIVGDNIAFYRRVQGLSQTELATRAGIDRRTVYEIEKGRPVRTQTIEKVCDVLDMKSTEMLNSVHLPERVDGSRPFFVHRRAEEHWYANSPLPTTGRLDYEEAMQSPEERNRLGRTGLVPSFRHALSFVMPRGPGLVIYEIHGRIPLKIYTHLYEDWVLFCQRGQVRVTLGGESSELEEGDVIGAVSWDGLFVEPAAVPVREAPPLLLAIGANRTGARRAG